MAWLIVGRIEGRAEHYSLGPFDGGNTLYTADSVRI